MNSRNAIQQELNDLRSSLPFDANKQPVFTVPDGYFENLAVSVLATLKSQQAVDDVSQELRELSPVLSAISKQTPFSVPENYFSHLATGLPALVNDEALPDVLQTHTKQMPYSVPPLYFDGLAAQVAAKVTKPTAKVVSFSTRFMRVAAAAVVIGVIALAGVFYLNGSNNASIDPATQPQAWIAQKLKNVPSRDLEAFLKTADTGAGTKELARTESKTDVRQLLTDVSTSEMDAFLSGLPSEGEFSSIN